MKYGSFFGVGLKGNEENHATCSFKGHRCKAISLVRNPFCVEGETTRDHENEEVKRRWASLPPFSSGYWTCSWGGGPVVQSPPPPHPRWRLGLLVTARRISSKLGERNPRILESCNECRLWVEKGRKKNGLNPYTKPSGSKPAASNPLGPPDPRDPSPAAPGCCAFAAPYSEAWPRSSALARFEAMDL